MLREVKGYGLELPKLYMATTAEDVLLAQKHGLPYIMWEYSMDDLIKTLLRPTLESLFPRIDWDAVLGPKYEFASINTCVPGGEHQISGLRIENAPKRHRIVDIAEEERVFDGGLEESRMLGANVIDYIGDMSSSVNLEALMRLNMLPKFVGNIVDCIKVNLGMGMRWQDGYNKKVGAMVGTHNTAPQLRNLIILDISGSIPDGISSTMITLINTLRNQVQADLIITAGTSRFYPFEKPLPSPDDIRNSFSYGNESEYFNEILKDHITGKKWGHVISFGDNDTPSIYTEKINPGTEIKHVHHFHTRVERRTGYAKWCHNVCPNCIEEFDTSWANVMI